MPRIAMSTWTFIFPPYEDRPQDLDSVLDRAAVLGFDGVELAWFEPHPTVDDLGTAAARAAYRDKLESRGLGLAGVVANFDRCPSILTNGNGEFLDALDRQLELCAEVGTDLLRLDITDPPEVMDTLDHQEAHERLVTTWCEAARLGANRGVRVGWEFEPGTPFNKPSEIFRIADEVTEPGFGIIYDTTQAHNCALGRNQRGPHEVLDGGQLEFLERLSGRITHVHLIDANGELYEDRFSRHIPFGRGHIDWETVMPALVAAGSGDDWWTIDVCWWDDAWPVFEEGLPFVRRLAERYAS